MYTNCPNNSLYIPNNGECDDCSQLAQDVRELEEAVVYLQENKQDNLTAGDYLSTSDNIISFSGIGPLGPVRNFVQSGDANVYQGDTLGTDYDLLDSAVQHGLSPEVLVSLPGADFDVAVTVEWNDNTGYWATIEKTNGSEITKYLIQFTPNATNLYISVRDFDIDEATLYGAKWYRISNYLERTRAAKDITTDTSNFGHFGSLNPNYNNPFDNIYPWSEMKVVDVNLIKYRTGLYSLKECIEAEYGDADFTYFGSSTTFVGRYRPEFWYKAEVDSSGAVEFLISQVHRGGFEYAPEAIDGISFAIDDGSGTKVTCGADVPLTNVAVSTIHARAAASGFALQDIYTLDEQIILYLVEYANMNIQEAIGYGCSAQYRQNAAEVISNVQTVNGVTQFDVTSSAFASYVQIGAQYDFGTSVGASTYKAIAKAYTQSGSTYTITLDRIIAITNGMYCSAHGFATCEFPYLGSSIGECSGYLGTNQKANAFYRGALLYANRYSYILGIYRETGTNHIWLCPKDLDPSDYDALNTSVHKDTGTALPILAAASWQTVGGNAQRISGLSAFMVTGTSSGSSNSPVGDQQYVPLPSAANTILLFGGNANCGWVCGVFCGAWSGAAGSSGWDGAGLPILKSPL